MSHLLVIGGASLDTLHFKGQTSTSAGGAGMYTAMAARRCGVKVSLFAPRPEPIPLELQPIAERLTNWFGPVVPPQELPHFEIAYEGGGTNYLKALFGSESTLTPESLPDDLSTYEFIHVVPLGDAHRQLEFIRACRARGARKISAGTYLRGVTQSPATIHAIIAQTDVFFLNQLEAETLCGSLESANTRAGKLLFITLGADGARVVQGGYAASIPSAPADELDPTGAGDTFCGATLAGLILNRHPGMAARHAVPLAAQMIEYVGPTALLWDEPPPAIPLDGRVTVDDSQVQKISALISNIYEATPFQFVTDELPPVHHHKTLEYFFAATLQQFSFWSEQNHRYHAPLVAPLGGVRLKGAFFLFAAFRRRLEVDADFCSPARQANMSRDELLDVFRADDGSDPMPALELHLEQANQYGRDMLALHLTPEAVLHNAQASPTPLRTLLAQLDGLGGYKEDPLRKKSGLLALILNQRPEHFLTFGEGEDVEPVIDYHLMRSALRTGLIDVLDADLKTKLINREIIDADDEWAVRHAAYRAIQQVVEVSGKPTGAVDWFFFSARQRCPEMTDPDCPRCAVDSACAHRKELFQPVIRTVFY
jgi:sugar/nucleoside kinase (ribokinase family)